MPRYRLVVGATLIALSVTPSLAGVSFKDRSATLPVRQSYEGEWTNYVGGGVAVMDCNGDGMPDFYAAGGTAPSRLFVNRSEPGGDIVFEPLDILPTTDVIGAYPMDIDGDARIDIVVLRNGTNMLLRGIGDCQFSTAPADWRFDGGNAWTTAFSATFEAGQDWPTLVFGNYVDQHNPKGPFETCDHNDMIRPEGRAFGPPQPLVPGFCALSMLISDWKRSGTPDLRISNDRQYYVSNGREQMWHLSPLAEYGAAEGWPIMKLWGMGIASRDITDDGLPEVFLTSMADQVMLLNRGNGLMEKAPYSIGTYAQHPYRGDDGRPSTGWHAEFGDIDNDGRDDLFIAKGNVNQMPSNAMHDPNNLLMQQDDGSFVEMGGVTGVGTTERSRGAAVVDLNRDGRLDLLVINRRAPMEIWQNTSSATGHWIGIDLHAAGANSRAIGSVVEIKLPDGRVQTREITIGGGHASGEAVEQHFGLGAATSFEIRVTWPDGRRSAWTRQTIDTVLAVSPGDDDTLTISPEF